MKRLESEQLESMTGRYSSCEGVVDGLAAIGGSFVAGGLAIGFAAPVAATAVAIGATMWGLSALFQATNACHHYGGRSHRNRLEHFYEI